MTESNAEQRKAKEVDGQIGPYKLLSVLGEGAYGIVFLAEQQKPIRRRVALKVIKPGMDSKQVIARFEAERQALALLDHPNIAHVFNAGTTKAGRPYFAMEHVEGVSITKYCDQQKLSIKERLELFQQVCEAVQYTHQRGIIHRDIKPSNILVSVEANKAIPKVIDFGVAKALTQTLTERTFFTEQGQLIGTPEYMSPEQAKMTDQNIDERSDIYSLGVLLYVLLTGTLPFDRKSLQQAGFEVILRIIQEQNPPRPSTRISTLAKEEAAKLAQCRRIDLSNLRRKLRGDLDWITFKTMEKDPARRYESAHALATDIQRYLNNEAVAACPPSKVYRFKKLTRRYRTQVIAAACAIFVILTVSVVTLISLPDELERSPNRGKTNSNPKDYTPKPKKSLIPEDNTVTSIIRMNQSFSIIPPSKKFVAGGWKASWSPDGTQMVCGKGDGWSAGLQVINLISGEIVELTDSGKDPAWSPDGRFIAYVMGDYISEEVWVINTSSGSRHKLVSGGFPSWAKDGKRVFVHSRKENKILTVEIDDPNAEPQVYCENPLSWYPAISPDGRKIAFGKPGALVVINRETDETVLTWTTPGTRGLLPAWSPDGKRIAFGSFGIFGLWVLDVETQEAVQVATGWCTMPAWSPDGTKLAFDRRRPGALNEVWIVETNDLAKLKPSLP